MSLSTGTPTAKRHAVPAAWRSKPPVQSSAPGRPRMAAPAAPKNTGSSTDGRAEQLFRRFEQLLPNGDHQFSQLRQDFAEWCAEGDVRPPSANQLAAMLRQAGLVMSRRGRAKLTVYAKARRALAA